MSLHLFAYIGPGAGLSLLGALVALVSTIGFAVFMVLAHPIRVLLKKRSLANSQQQQDIDNRESSDSTSLL